MIGDPVIRVLGQGYVIFAIATAMAFLFLGMRIRFDIYGVVITGLVAVGFSVLFWPIVYWAMLFWDEE